MLDERQLGLDRIDRNRVPARVLRAQIPVRRIQERLGEVAPGRGARLREEQLRREHRRARGHVRGHDGHVRRRGYGAHARVGGDRLLRQRRVVLVDRVQLVAAHDDVARAGAGGLVDLALDVERARRAFAHEPPDRVAALGNAPAEGAKSGCGEETRVRGTPTPMVPTPHTDSKRKGKEGWGQRLGSKRTRRRCCLASIWVTGTHQVRNEHFRANLERHVRMRGRRSRECDDWRARDKRCRILFRRNKHAIA